MRTLFITCLLNLFLASSWAQKASKIVYMDLAHGQRMWNDPKDPVSGIGFGESSRIQYMNEELNKSLSPYAAKVYFLKENINYKDLKKGSLLIIHVPSLNYTKNEVKDIKRYLKNGGSLLLVMEADYWTDIKKTNVNEIILDHGIQYGGQSQDTLAGGYTKKGTFIADKLKVTYQLGRSIEGGIPFVYNSQTNEAFGVYRELDKGGKLIVLGDAMASLYMKEWKEVNDYQCHEFMQEIFDWFLKE